VPPEITMNQLALLEILMKLLRLPREEGTVEFKSNLDEPKEIGEYISALANTAALHDQDRAWLVWGIENGSHEVKGTVFDPFDRKVKEGSNQALIMWLQMMTQPRADFTFHEVQHEQGRVVLLEIHPARSAPVAFQQLRYIRIDSHKVRLSEHPDKEARLWSQLGVKEDWSGELVPGATLDDLDPEAINAARLRFTDYLVRSEPDADRHDAIRIEAAGWSTTMLLNKARITKQGRVTPLCLVAFGQGRSNTFSCSGRRQDQLDSSGCQQWHADFAAFWYSVSAQHRKAFFSIRNITLDHMPDGTLFPTPVQQYDAWVLREALHNCVAHQDYLLGGKINLVEHPDRLVLTNLGQFFPVSVEWMLEHQSPPEHYRNQWLIDGMI